MASGTYYIQECPTCGRSLQIRIEYLGKHVACQHCSAKFKASDPSNANYAPMNASSSMLARAEELIESVAHSAPDTTLKSSGDN